MANGHSGHRSPPIWRYTVFLLSLLATTHVQGDSVSKFIFPDTNGLVLNTQDTILVSYISPFPSPGLYLWCWPGPHNVWAEDAAAPFNGTQPVFLNFTSDKPCWFNLRRVFDGPDGANGPEFDILSTTREGGSQTISTVDIATVSATSQTTSATDLTSSSPSTATTPDTTTTSTRTTIAPISTGISNQTNSTSPEGGGGGGMSATTAMGIAIGSTAGAIILVIAIFMCLRRFKRRIIEEAALKVAMGSGGGGSSSQYTGPATTTSTVIDSAVTSPYTDTTSYRDQLLSHIGQAWPRTPLQEISADRDRVEMATERYVAEMGSDNGAAEISTSYLGYSARFERYA
ncbi:hypothetical protein B0H66DRAFT_381404 [Apodospora peruviana]|uniref:Mid2 domain-containing protein n=1 Tax=Apodospora peruviana TaxID=516989 RepID=A0AAE0HTY8_9PEZI|nr:hypothetical protein B0H66DRAFT_381404 [Apodospora peruviana]